MTDKSLADQIRDGDYFECGDIRYGLNVDFIHEIADKVQALEERLERIKQRHRLISRLSPRLDD